MYRFGEPQPSYWEASVDSKQVTAEKLAGSQSCDVAVIGGGYTGLSAAYHLARDFQIDVRVLEAGHIGWGASGRNGGFCSVGGSKLELDKELSTFGVDNVRHYYQSQVDAIRLVKDIIQTENIDTPVQGDSELEVAHSPRAFRSMKNHAERQLRLLGLDLQVLSADAFRERFFDSKELYGATRLRPTFGLHPMRYVLGLANATQRVGATLHPHTEVLNWSKSGGNQILATAGGTLRARRVVMASNGFMPENLREEFFGVPLPVISAIIVTRPLTDDELARHAWQTENPSINSRELLNYFRLLPDKRFLFGGRGHATGSANGARQIFEKLKSELHRQWPAWQDIDIDYRWHGLVCMTRRMTPCVGTLDDDPNVYFGFGYHGNGVNTSTWAGKQIADWIGSGESDAPATLPAMVRGLSPRYPLASQRLNYLALALRWKRFQDRR
jgi:glycine/D-amino acid oxidase-like deaminating enzyme